jgi:hypothetical protein
MTFCQEAEREGFEPPLGFHLKKFSRLPHSTALPSLQSKDSSIKDTCVLVHR